MLNSDQLNNNKLIEYLKSYKKDSLIFIPTPGKIGDALLAYSTYEIFDKYNVNYNSRICQGQYRNKHIIIGGGGNLIGHLYNELRQFINNNFKNNKITILPHTIYNISEIYDWLNKPDFIVFCRELVTFEALKDIKGDSKNIYLVEDMSCFLDIEDFLQYKISGRGTCNAFRDDAESAMTFIPEDNFDVSKIWNGPFWHNRNLCYHAVHSMASYLSAFRVVNTDRLHTAILAGIIGKRVNLYPGTYYKIKSVYEFTIKSRWSNIQLRNLDESVSAY